MPTRMVPRILAPSLDLGSEVPQQILIADDHPLMRSALRQAVEQAFPGVTITEAARYDQIRAVLDTAATSPTSCCSTCTCPACRASSALMMRVRNARDPVLVVSAAEDAGTIQRSIDYGASGFVPKSAPLGQVAEAIRAVLDGEIWQPDAPAAPADDAAAMAGRAVNLTPQQLRVLLGMAEGKLNKQIAFEMSIAEQTVKDHVTVILRKLGAASNRTRRSSWRASSP